jgi:hypothetical protein
MADNDFSKILISEQIREVKVEFKGQEWNFKLREIPWVMINKIASRCMDYNGKKVLIDRSEFDIQFLEAALVEAPWPLDQTRMVVRRINKEFGNILRTKVIPEPLEGENEELKNE